MEEPDDNIAQDSAAGAGTLTPRMFAWAKNSSLYRLNRRMMSEHELFEALRRKALSKFEDVGEEGARKLAEHGVAFCREHGFLDDRHYAEIKAANGARSGRSRRRIARDLGIKGVARPLIEETLEEVDDLGSAIAFARKRAFGPFRKVELDEKRKLKEFSAFARNGFSSDVARKVLSLSETELEEMEDALPRRL
ncbi:regulatory protein RecX [Gellertiella hungarica]|uniref:Regulatory protein RecX n=1 Tax=Gellertiella hungarica TaxID=1572859 RepID=A0A7W6J561_9HYPH|nr:RecX family transcriptional regulator [Gellertiella hungarica]MBB4064086.1 regulatory protein [Gellertiella hungarica]